LGNVVDFYQHRFDSVVGALQDMTPQQRVSAIAASCDGDDWWELLKLAAYCIGAHAHPALPGNYDQASRRKAIACPLHCAIDGVIGEATATT
jgi:hypothetical protein